MFDISDFKRRFPFGVGRPIQRRRVKVPNGVAWMHQGGPVDLKDPDTTQQQVLRQLCIGAMEGATVEDISQRASGDVRGIIYDADGTYRQFIWLTVARRYKLASEGGGPAATHVRSAKVPFLIWLGSEYSFVSFQTASYFFAEEEIEHRHLQLDVDGESFVFNSPDEQSGFGHWSILGKDFLESRFCKVEADYSTLTVACQRRKRTKPPCRQPKPTLDWVRRRDEELEKYLQMDDEDGEDDDDSDDSDDDICIEVFDDDSGGESNGEGYAQGAGGANVNPASMGKAGRVGKRLPVIEEEEEGEDGGFITPLVDKDDASVGRHAEGILDAEGDQHKTTTLRAGGNVRSMNPPLRRSIRRVASRVSLASKESSRVIKHRVGSGLRI